MTKKKPNKLKTFRIVTIESWSTKVWYKVEAKSEDEAIGLVNSREVDFYDHDHLGEDVIDDIWDITEEK